MSDGLFLLLASTFAAIAWTCLVLVAFPEGETNEDGPCKDHRADECD